MKDGNWRCSSNNWPGEEASYSPKSMVHLMGGFFCFCFLFFSFVYIVRISMVCTNHLEGGGE